MKEVRKLRTASFVSDHVRFGASSLAGAEAGSGPEYEHLNSAVDGHSAVLAHYPASESEGGMGTAGPAGSGENDTKSEAAAAAANAAASAAAAAMKPTKANGVETREHVAKKAREGAPMEGLYDARIFRRELRNAIESAVAMARPPERERLDQATQPLFGPLHSSSPSGHSPLRSRRVVGRRRRRPQASLDHNEASNVSLSNSIRIEDFHASETGAAPILPPGASAAGGSGVTDLLGGLGKSLTEVIGSTLTLGSSTLDPTDVANAATLSGTEGEGRPRSFRELGKFEYTVSPVPGYTLSLVVFPTNHGPVSCLACVYL